MYWTEINFGKYKEAKKTLPEIIFEDPDYFLWGIDNNIFQQTIELKNEADDLYSKIKAIKIPGNDDHEQWCEFFKNPVNGRIEFQIKEKPSKSENVIERSGFIDLSIPYEYDSSIGITKNILPKLFLVLFGNNKYPGKYTTEAFFDNNDNFGIELWE